MNPLAPLFAQGAGDWIGIVLVILFIIVPAILQLFGKGKQPQQRQARPQRPPRPPAAPPAGGEVEDEIGEFLRRAVERRGGERPGGGRPGPPPPPQRVAQPVGPEVVRNVPLGSEVREHIDEYLDAGDFDHRASELGVEVARADDKLDERLHAKFDHEVSRLATLPSESAAFLSATQAQQPEDRIAELPSTAAAGLPALFSNAESIRQAIVIHEVLQRPEQRWT